METLIREEDRITFLYEIEKLTDYGITFKVYEVTEWTTEYDTIEPSATELYLTAYMKWDNCFHFWFGEEDGYLHLCGKYYIDGLKQVLDACYELAKEKIKAFEDES